MKNAAVLAIVLVVVAGKLAGWYVIGHVGSGSMEPTLPQGSLFFAVQGEADVGDIVVFEARGERITHRVVDIQSDGALVTQGDANRRTDVETGLGPVDPRTVQVVSTFRGEPVHLSGALANPAVLAAVQVSIVSAGVLGLVKAGRGGKSLRPSTSLMIAAVMLLATAPALDSVHEVQANVPVKAPFMPLVAQVAGPSGTTVVELAPFEQAVIPASGTVRVSVVPDLPGAALLLPYGTLAGLLPGTALLAIVAVLGRAGGL